MEVMIFLGVFAAFFFLRWFGRAPTLPAPKPLPTLMQGAAPKPMPAALVPRMPSPGDIWLDEQLGCELEILTIAYLIPPASMNPLSVVPSGYLPHVVYHVCSVQAGPEVRVESLNDFCRVVRFEGDATSSGLRRFVRARAA